MTGKTIKITVHPTGGKGRPLSVEDAMSQILDIVQLLEAPARGRESAARYSWAVVSASTNSPLTIEVAPFGSETNTYAWMAAADEDIAVASDGLINVFEGKVIPTWLDAKSTYALKRVAKRNTNGIGVTEINFDDAPPLLLDRARSENALEVLKLYEAPDMGDIGKHRARGEVSGRMTRAGEYYHQPAFWIENKAGSEIACTLAQGLIDKVGGETTLRDIWKNRYLILRGIKYFDSSGNLLRIEVTEEPELRDLHPVNLEAVEDKEFTGGVGSADYIRQLRGES